MKTTAFWAGYYGFRSDASEAFIQGYLDEVQRLDQRGQGVACGRGWIPRSKKCSRDKASQTSDEAKAKTVERAKARGKLKGEVKAAKGQKPYVKPKPEPEVKPKKERKPRAKKESTEPKPKPIKSYGDFKESFLQEQSGIDKDSNLSNIVPIHRVLDAMKDRVSEKQFGEWMYELQANGDIQLMKGDGKDKPFTLPNGMERSLVKRISEPSQPRPKKKSTSQNAFKTKEKFESEFDKMFNEMEKEHQGRVPIHLIRKKMGDRASRDEFNDWLLGMQADDKVQLEKLDIDFATPEMIEGSIPRYSGTVSYYVRRAKKR